jgi:hypothetical protein
MTDNWALRNYIPNAFQSQSQIDNTRWSFTLWENVQKHDPSVCGAYVSYWDLWLQMQMSRNQQISISFPVVIKYDSLIIKEKKELFIITLKGDIFEVQGTTLLTTLLLLKALKLQTRSLKKGEEVYSPHDYNGIIHAIQ